MVLSAVLALTRSYSCLPPARLFHFFDTSDTSGGLVAGTTQPCSRMTTLEERSTLSTVVWAYWTFISHLEKEQEFKDILKETSLEFPPTASDTIDISIHKGSQKSPDGGHACCLLFIFLGSKNELTIRLFFTQPENLRRYITSRNLVHESKRCGCISEKCHSFS